MSPNQVAKSSLWKDCILTQNRPSQECSPLPHIRSRQLLGSIFFADLSSLRVVSSDSLLWGRISSCTTFRFPKSSSFVGDSLARSVTSSTQLAWGCGHQEGLRNFQIVPKLVISMPFPLPISNSTLLFERGTLITPESSQVSVLSSAFPFPLGQSQFSSLSRTSTTMPLHNSCRRPRPPNPRKGCMLSPLLQTRTDILIVLWVSSSLQLGLNYDARHAPPRTSCCRTSVFHQVSHDSLETVWSHPLF